MSWLINVPWYSPWMYAWSSGIFHYYLLKFYGEALAREGMGSKPGILWYISMPEAYSGVWVKWSLHPNPPRIVWANAPPPSSAPLPEKVEKFWGKKRGERGRIRGNLKGKLSKMWSIFQILGIFKTLGGGERSTKFSSFAPPPTPNFWIRSDHYPDYL